MLSHHNVLYTLMRSALSDNYFRFFANTSNNYEEIQYVFFFFYSLHELIYINTKITHKKLIKFR